ncbi:MAG: glycoside hydrolase family 16 protein [Clostridiales bacterium]|nr:glycoside hydrolase family 16 protein [Clostridiales bacterium]
MKKRFLSFLIALLSVFGAAAPENLGLARKPADKALDKSKFQLVWQDEFDGDSVDWNKWSYEWWVTERRGGFWHKDMLEVKDGKLIIHSECLDHALENEYYEKWKDEIDFKDYKPGWYTSQITTNGKYEQKYGYFEARCKVPASTGMWSAFWMMNDGVYEIDGTGNDGTEIDVFESLSYNLHRFGLDTVESNLHFDGYREAHRYKHVGKYLIKPDPYADFVTYGVEWNPDEYIFYVNGKETARSSFGGVSDNPEYLLLSTEIAGNNGIAEEDPKNTGRMRIMGDEHPQFEIEYVRCYQYKDILENQ